MYHVPVMLTETLDGLCIKPDGVYVDATFGGGGHSRAILERLGEHGRLLGFDQDLDAAANTLDDKRFTFVRGNFRYLKNFLRYYGVEKVDGILADLGVSSHHFDDEQRGFSFRFEAALDMRMNQCAQCTAADVLNAYDEARLADLFFYYGELRQARRIAGAVVSARAVAPITTVAQLLDVVRPFFPRERDKKEAAKVFQALRIEVNDEMGALRALLAQAVDVLRPGGRLAVLTYHSLEDRLVKNFVKTGRCDGRQERDFYGNMQTPFVAVNNRVVVASSDEVAENPRARSAKLRVAERVEE
ncbi:MAG: 16S rRNA (cytosine(1402)-N(4))-methyltransferase RsmH [Paludibacteraceae bacterium]